MSGIDATTSVRNQINTQTSVRENTGKPLLDDMNANWVPKPNPPFKSLDEALAARAAGTISPGNNAVFKDTAKLSELLGRLSSLALDIAFLKDSVETIANLKNLLDTGDIEGAVMALQTSRAKGLEKQLGTRISALQDRNAMIATKNSELSELQKRVGTKGKYDNGKDFTEANNKSELDSDITKKKGEIDQLNSDSQIDMIGLQSLVNKRNESFDTLTNLLGKFQKTIDGIVGNYR